jgi:putative DNA primase/helicase
VCEALVGTPDNHSGISVDSLVTNFGLERTIGKTLITIGDARFSTKSARDALPKLLSIVGEDETPVDRKNRPQWKGVLPGRFMISTNEPPNIPDSASAMKRRTLLLYFHETFVGREDRGLFARLVTELPGILNWALNGYDRLVSRGEYTDNWTIPAASRVITEEMDEMGAPVKQFMRECCLPVADSSTPKATLYEAWSRWCDEQGKHATSSPVFFRDLFAAYPKLRSVRPGSGRASGVRVYQVDGVALKVESKSAGDLR